MYLHDVYIREVIICLSTRGASRNPGLPHAHVSDETPFGCQQRRQFFPSGNVGEHQLSYWDNDSHLQGL